MPIHIQTSLRYSAAQPCDLLLQIEAAEDETQIASETDFAISQDVETRLVAGEERVGLRRWMRVTAAFECTYSTVVTVQRPIVPFRSLQPTPLVQCPSDVTKYLMPSRYCHPEAFFDFAPREFGGLTGGALVSAMSDWVTRNFTYDNGASNASTTATDSLAARAGVCRDYAHVLIAMARSVGIPARFVSAYAPDVTPQDFHAVVEVFLSGAWQLIDPTGMAQPAEIVRIGVGRDAADASFMTSYGWMTLQEQSVQVSRID